MIRLAKVFKSGKSQAVRLPKEFRFYVDEVEGTREGDAVILRPHTKNSLGWSSLRSALKRGVSDDFIKEGREQRDGPGRSEMDKIFE